MTPVRRLERYRLERRDGPHDGPGGERRAPGQPAVDARWLVRDAAAEVAARCSLWWTAAPALPGQRVGLIGHYAAAQGGAASRLLDAACEELRDRGCTLAVGPVDGSTWDRYRLITARGSEPAFFLEPDNPEAWPVHFTDNGFVEVAGYVSALNTDLGRPDPRTAEAAARLAGHGIGVRPLRHDRLEEEIGSLHAVVMAAFAGTFLYTPIGEADFVARHLGLAPYLDPALVLIAECRGCPVGFVFAIPDQLERQRGEPVRTVIVKTLAVRPDHAGLGLGGFLLARCQEIAHERGYARAIHALIREGNRSRVISARSGRQIRRYALFGRSLGAER